MHNQSEHAAADLADREILRGPPGLLFGLTLLIFAAARLCFGWDVPSTSQKDAASQSASAEADADNSEPLLTRAVFINQ